MLAIAIDPDMTAGMIACLDGRTIRDLDSWCWWYWAEDNKHDARVLG